MIEIQKIITGFLLGWFVYSFEPIRWVLSYLKPYKVYSYINKVISCPKCSSFWMTLIFTQNIIFAIAAAFIADTWDRNFNTISI